MCDTKPKVALSDLILAAICFLQEKNGVTACEIAQYVADKRGCKLEQIETMIKMILCKAKNQCIFSEKKGLYRIEPRYDDLPKADDEPVSISEDEDEDEDDDDDDNNCEDDDECDEEPQPEPEPKPDKRDPCTTLRFSKNNLEDIDDEEERCPAKKRKA